MHQFYVIAVKYHDGGNFGKWECTWVYSSRGIRIHHDGAESGQQVAWGMAGAGSWKIIYITTSMRQRGQIRNR